MKFSPKLFLLYIPWLLALLCSPLPQLSYLIAWLGSILILLFTVTGKIMPVPHDLPKKSQFMRPLFLTQVIFVGYMALTSVFFFMDTLGFRYFETLPYSLVDYRSLDLVAECQRYYCLAHASYTTGLLLLTRSYRHRKWEIHLSSSYSVFFIKATLVLIVLTAFFAVVPGLDQFAVKFRDLSYISSIMAFVYAIIEKNSQRILISGFIFGFSFLAAFLSGWKEPIVVTIIVLGGYLYPMYRRTVTLAFVPLFLVSVFILPSYNSIFRQLSWGEGIASEQAAQSAFEAIQQGDVDFQTDNWSFLTDRLSEVSMFVEYVDKVPSRIDYFGSSIFTQSVLFLVPRVFWPDKPDVEQHVMQRVYKIGVINQNMDVSAKPPLVVDAYLTGGPFFIFFFLLLMGMLTAWISNQCEHLFGGYNFGSAWVFAGLFQILWRGTCMEFLFNSIFWGIITMYLMAFVMRKMGYIRPSHSS